MNFINVTACIVSYDLCLCYSFILLVDVFLIAVVLILHFAVVCLRI